MSSTLFTANSTWALWAFLALGAAVSVVLEQRYRWASAVSGAVLGLAWGLVGVNLRIVPAEAPVWDAVWTFVVPLALPLLLLQTDLRKIYRESGRLFWIFNLSSLGTMLGGLVAGRLFRGLIPDAHKAAGVMTGSYIGGTVNFVAMGAVLAAPKSMLNALVVADNLVMAVAFGALVAIPNRRFFRDRFAHPFEDEARANEGQGTPAASYWRAKEISLEDVALCLAVAFTVSGIADGVSGWIGRRQSWPEALRTALGQRYLLIPLLSVILSTLAPGWVGRIRGAHELGTYLIYLFFVVIGVPASIAEIVRNGPVLLALTALMASVNIAFTLGAGRLFGFSIEECVTASNANLGGPTTAAGMVVGKGWSRLVLPTILVGVWGYIVGNYLGLLIAQAARALP